MFISKGSKVCICDFPASHRPTHRSPQIKFDVGVVCSRDPSTAPTHHCDCFGSFPKDLYRHALPGYARPGLTQGRSSPRPHRPKPLVQFVSYACFQSSLDTLLVKWAKCFAHLSIASSELRTKTSAKRSKRSFRQCGCPSCPNSDLEGVACRVCPWGGEEAPPRSRPNAGTSPSKFRRDRTR
ncbi:MAG: hypothetical protein ACI8W3_002289 [Myxococcota bacterium]|jgi:hypothetical protein